MCELPLLETVAGFTQAEVQSFSLSPRLQAHVMGHVFCNEVLRLDKDKTGKYKRTNLAL